MDNLVFLRNDLKENSWWFVCCCFCNGRAGKAVSRLEAGMGLKEAIKAGKEGFAKERERANLEEKIAGEKYPGVTLASQLGGAALTAPLTAVKGLSGAIKLGATAGLGTGLSKGEDLGDVAGETLKGAVLGGVTQKTFDIAGGTLKKIAESEIGQKVLEKTKSASAKVANLISGVPENEVKTLIDKGDEVAAIIKRSGGDLTGEADKLRQNIQSSIQKTRTTANSQIEKALEEFPKDKFIPVDELLIKMRDIRNKVDSRINPESTLFLTYLINVLNPGHSLSKVGSKNLNKTPHPDLQIGYSSQVLQIF